MENKKWNSSQSLIVISLITVIFTYIVIDAFFSKPKIKDDIIKVKNEYVKLSNFLDEKMPEIDSTFKMHARQIQSTQKALQETFFKTYYTPYPSPDQTRSNEKQATAFEYYDNGQFFKSKKLFQRVLKEYPNNYMAKFYLAMCEIELENYVDAETYLEDLILTDHLFYEQSHWYLALVYINEARVKSAKEILQIIVDEEMYKKSDANIIYNVINE